jgi:hypothetical protein
MKRRSEARRQSTEGSDKRSPKCRVNLGPITDQHDPTGAALVLLGHHSTQDGLALLVILLCVVFDRQEIHAQKRLLLAE